MNGSMATVVCILMAACASTGPEPNATALADGAGAGCDAVAPCHVCTAAGRVVAAPTTACDDGTPCTVEDRCVGGQCVGKAKDCDDASPCTVDSCDAATGCVWTPVDATCTDANPCTIQETCVAGECKGAKKPCDDDNPCTMDSCDDKTGDCGFENNAHPNCVPVLAWTSPMAGLLTSAPTVPVTGSVASGAGKVLELLLNGKAQSLQPDGTFQVAWPLTWGQNLLTLQAFDATGGERHAVRGVTASSQWSSHGPSGLQLPAAMVVSWGAAANPLGPGQASLPGPIVVPRLFGKVPVTLTLAQDATAPATDTVSLAWTVTATTSLAPAAPGLPSPGIPLRAACGAQPMPPKVVEPDGKQAYLSIDALNALLWAQWHAGWFEDDASVLLASLGLPASEALSVAMHALQPPLLADCPTPAWRLHVTGLLFKTTLGDTYGTVGLHFDAAVEVSVVDGALRLSFGAAEHVQTDIDTNNDDTDLHRQMEKMARDKAIPAMLTVWRNAGLLTVPLPGKGWKAAKLATGGVVISGG